MPVESAPDAKAVTEAEGVEQATREGLSSSNIVSTRDKQPSTTRRKQNALGRPLLLFPVKDAVKSNDLEDNKTIDNCFKPLSSIHHLCEHLDKQVSQALQSLIIKLMPQMQRSAQQSRSQPKGVHRHHCMCFVADSVTYDACSAVAFAASTLEKCNACCAKLVLYKSLHPLL